LGKWIPVAETNPTSLDANHDPYVLWRQIRHHLFHVVDEQNVLDQHLLALQERCQHFDSIIVQRIQKAIKDYCDATIKQSNYSVTVAQELNGISMIGLTDVSDCHGRACGKGMEVLFQPRIVVVET
jgi:hypothetical protein